jgi:hypothetical protein
MGTLLAIMKHVSLTSVYVERSFSIYKHIIHDKTNITLDHIFYYDS